MTNEMLVIAPYWVERMQAWVYDDMGRLQEPFVEGIPAMIDHLVQDIPNARNGFRLIFSAKPFPNFQQKLEWVREDCGGNWYRTIDPPMEGWLCPALFDYFDTAPVELYVKAEQMAAGG